MKKILLSLFALTIYSISFSQSTICSWNVRQQMNYGLNPFAATSTSSAISSGGLNRAAGVGTTGTAIPRAWGGTGWNHATPSEAIATNAFITTPILVRDGYTISFAALESFYYRNSINGPTNALFQCRVDTGSYVNITTIGLSPTGPSGIQVGTLDLSQIPSLQNLAAGVFVTFRLVPYGAASDTSSWYIYDGNDNDNADFAFSSTISNVVQTFYPKASGPLNELTTWGTNTDGTGTQPTSFTSDNRIYRIVNRPMAATINDWLIAGLNTVLYVGDGTNDIQFVPAAARDFTLGAGATMVINAKATLIIPTGANVDFSNNRVTLKSTSLGTGQIGRVQGILQRANNITVERFIPSNGRKSYTLVSSPVNAPSVFNSWQEGGADTTGYGTIITGASAGNGFDAASASGLASVFSYNDLLASGSKWQGLTNTTFTAIGAGKGFLLYVRGDRTIKPNSTSNGDATLRANGAMISGDTTLTTLTGGAGKFSFIANPYPGTINWISKSDTVNRDIVLNNLDDIFYVYDPSIGTFASYNGATNTVSPSTSKQPMSFIQSGQAFFVRANGTNPSITFKEAAKATVTSAVSNTVFGVESVRQVLNVNIYKANEHVFADGVVALFDNNYDKGISKEDAIKFPNLNENVSLLRGGQKLSIEGKPLINSRDTLFLSLENFSKTEYEFVLNATGLKDIQARLEDRYTGVKQLLNFEDNTTYKFKVNSDAASSATDRFIITFGNSQAITLTTDVNADNNLFISLSPNPVKNQLHIKYQTGASGNTLINIINIEGKLIKSIEAGRQNAGSMMISTEGFAPGVYNVQLIKEGKVAANSKMVKE